MHLRGGYIIPFQDKVHEMKVNTTVNLRDINTDFYMLGTDTAEEMVMGKNKMVA